MSVYAAEFSGCVQAVYRSADKNGERFCVAFQPPALSRLSLTRSLSPRDRIAGYVLHMHSFINLRRDTASSDTRTRALKRGQETCL